MTTTLEGRRVAILAADGVERVELDRPRQALEDAGARTRVVSITTGEIKARRNDLDAFCQRIVRELAKPPALLTTSTGGES